ncbi:hypothetical protein LIER_42290 [Lithospermum erythrorhizon]|uniref:Uncharacterized protein n=1 Tax=Lithospermum erythrorhizon TaxID=34254 RepID=A0AAV3RT13_LITER
MDWLAAHYASLDCRENKAHGMLRKGCKGYIAIIIDITRGNLRLVDIHIVREFPDVFLEDLNGLPPDRDIEFSI